MCLIIVNKDFKKSELIKDMKEKYYFYPDLFGLMYAKNNKLITKLIRPKSFKDCLDLFNTYKSNKNEMVLHFAKSKSNCNVYPILWNTLQAKQIEQEREKNKKCV
tara:strand:- start:69 stop:383 length:315 start_codon:yes stop_codon:yes gene_type:complete